MHGDDEVLRSYRVIDCIPFVMTYDILGFVVRFFKRWDLKVVDELDGLDRLDGLDG